MFKPGDEVTPYNPEWTDEHLRLAGLVRGGVYIVSAAWFERDSQAPGPAILLAGVTVPIGESFRAVCFRKVQRRRSEAAVEELKRICLPQRAPEAA